jgi:Haem-binding domain
MPREKQPRSSGWGVRFGVPGSLLLWLLVSFLVHPLSREATDRADAPMLLGAEVPPPVIDTLSHACANCHSEKTNWPWYSNLAPASWLVEYDVKRARKRLNLSRWDKFAATEQRRLLTAIATVVENREMPLHRYVLFHPTVKLSPDDSTQVIDWTLAERRRLREAESQITPK